jgi:hypothetical protein
MKTTGMRKFIEAARTFRTGQMKELRDKKFFSPAEVRDGLKRYIHLKHIECN